MLEQLDLLGEEVVPVLRREFAALPAGARAGRADPRVAGRGAWGAGAGSGVTGPVLAPESSESRAGQVRSRSARESVDRTIAAG